MGRALLLGLLLALAPGQPALAESMRATSPDHRVALLELYTSEGCSSCPPADRLLSRIRESGMGPDQLVPLALHVSYWDYIGWRDRFADPAHDARQRRQVQLAGGRSVYTPQFLLNGRDFRALDTLGETTRAIAAQPAPLRLELTATPRDRELQVELRLSEHALASPQLYLALYQHGLASQVTAGENSGRELEHDYVVRQLIGPLRAPTTGAALRKTIPLPPDASLTSLGLAAFAQAEGDGEILQAVALGLDRDRP